MPIPILQYGVKVRDPTTKQFSDLAALRGEQGPQGAAGPGVPAGGADGDVLVKDGATDYAAKWTNTPRLLENIATINHTSAAETTYAKGAFLVYNGKLYMANVLISQDEQLTPGGNISITSALSACFFNDTGVDGLYGKTFSGLAILYGAFNGSFSLPAYSTIPITTTLRQELRPSVDTGRAIWMGRDSNSNVMPIGIIIRTSGEITAYNMSGSALQLSSITGTSTYLL